MNAQLCPRCGKQNPADIHTCTPLALKLADLMEHQVYRGSYNWERVEPMMLKAAAELRRLHAENEALRESLKTEELISFRRQMQQYAAQVEKDEALLRQALEALEKYRKMMFVEAGCRFGEGDSAIAALREELKEKI